MASKSAIFILFNVLLFTAANACGGGCGPGKSTPPPRPPPKRITPGGGGGGAPCPPPPPPPSDATKCPADALKLGVCANVLNGLINATVGRPPKEPCCSLLDGLVDLEAAVCLCTVIKANILGIKLNLPIDLSLVLNYCGKSAPKGFQCF